MTRRKIRIVVADDHAIVRMGLVALLATEADFEVVGEAEDGREAVALTERTLPDVVIMDLLMPVLDGIAATREIVTRFPTVKVLVLTTSGSTQELSSVLEAGAHGLVVKRAANSEMLTSLRAVLAGEHPVSAEARRILSDSSGLADLTGRQLDIIQAVARGLTNREIATLFDITPDGVKAHVRRICEKIGAANRSEAVAIALREHLLKL